MQQPTRSLSEQMLYNPQFTDLKASILRNTLATLTVQEILQYHFLYGKIFFINDGQILDFL